MPSAPPSGYINGCGITGLESPLKWLRSRTDKTARIPNQGHFVCTATNHQRILSVLASFRPGGSILLEEIVVKSLIRGRGSSKHFW